MLRCLQPSTSADVLHGFATRCLTSLAFSFRVKPEIDDARRKPLASPQKETRFLSVPPSLPLSLLLSGSLHFSSRSQKSMAPNGFSPCMLCALFLILSACASETAPLAHPISDDTFESRALAGRQLLQARQNCPVNFEFLNYTNIISECKGPTYPAKVCCGAFKEFACPYADVLNDLTNDCASTMFSYINLYGKYPPGLFAAECKEGTQGLECPASAPSSVVADTSRAQITFHAPLRLVLSIGFIIFVFHVLFGPRL